MIKASTTDFLLQKDISYDVFSNAPRIRSQKPTAYRARSIFFFGLIFTILHRFVFQLKKTFFSVAIVIFIHSVEAQIQSKKRNSLQNNNLQSQRSKIKQMLISYFISSPLHQYPSFQNTISNIKHIFKSVPNQFFGFVKSSEFWNLFFETLPAKILEKNLCFNGQRSD